MKQIILLFSIIFFAICVDLDYEEKLGPAHNVEDRGVYRRSCSDLYVRKNGQWLDDNYSSSNFVPLGVSDCVDLHLWSKAKNTYFDKCCYVRFQKDGEMHSGCVGLKQDNYADITETMRRMQKGDRVIWTREGEYSKIYQLDCSSVYLQYISFAALLLFGFLL